MSGEKNELMKRREKADPLSGLFIPMHSDRKNP